MEKINERKEAKLKLEGARSEQLKERRSEEYNVKNKKVKWSTGKDKRNSLEKRAATAEKAVENGSSKELYSITKSITGERQNQGVEEKQRVLSTETKERLQREVEHFDKILNRDDPWNPVVEDETVELGEIEEIIEEDDDNKSSRMS